MIRFTGNLIFNKILSKYLNYKKRVNFQTSVFQKY
jgi:hypothetical protein